MKIIESKDVYKILTMETCIELMKTALAGKAFQPMRTIHVLPGSNLYGFMPVYLGKDDYFGAKVISQFPKNIERGLPSHMGYVLLCESTNGSTVGMVDAMSITELRTGAVSGVATDLLARKDAKKLAIIGCGAQGRGHLEAMLLVRPRLELVSCYDIKAEAAEKYAAEQSQKHGIPVRAAASVEEAVKDVDIICTVTPSKEAYLKAEWVKPGCHINAVGTFSKTTREVTSELMAISKLYADEKGALMKESGEYLIPLAEGLITEDHIIGNIGGIINGTVPARESETEITLFDALGQAVEDVMAAKYVFLNSGRI